MAPPAPPDPAAPAPPAADPDASTARDPRFGDPGQIALNGALSASLGRLGYDNSNATSTTFGVEPAFDYFSAPAFSQGATAFFRYVDAAAATGIEVKTATVGLTGRIGFNFWLARRVSFWPKLAVGAWRSWLTYSAAQSGFTVNINGTPVPIGPSSKFTEDAVFIEVQAPFLFHLAEHFFVGIGPTFYVDVIHTLEGSSNRRRFTGVSSTVGGWF